MILGWSMEDKAAQDIHVDKDFSLTALMWQGIGISLQACLYLLEYWKQLPNVSSAKNTRFAKLQSDWSLAASHVSLSSLTTTITASPSFVGILLTPVHLFSLH